MAKLKHLFYVIVILYSIILIGWKLTAPPKVKYLAKENEKDITVHGLKTTYFNEKGHVENQLETPLAVHDESENTNTAVKPHIIATPRRSNKSADNMDETVTLDADSLVYDNKKHVSHYLGHVKLTQGQSQLRAHSATTKMDSHNKLEKAIAKALPNERVHFWKTSDKDKQNPTIHAYAKVITYLPKEGHIVLNGNALVKQGENTYRSEHIVYDINKKAVISKKIGNHRTTITLDSKIS